MKSQNHKKSLIFVFGLFLIITVVGVSLNTSAYPNEGTLGCHPGGYTIDGISEIEGEVSSSYSLEITATGPDVVIDIYLGAKNNDAFTIVPSNVITDNSDYDLDNATDYIKVLLNITLPSQTGIYTLRILSRAPTLIGEDTPIGVVDIKVTVGEVIITPLVSFFDNYNLYLGGIAVLFMSIGTIIYQINVHKKLESKAHGVFMTIAFIITSVTIFLILNDTMIYSYKSIELTSSQYIGQLNNIILGTIGYVAGIIVVFGTYTNVPGSKMKFAVYTMLLVWSLNFFIGIIVPTPSFALGGL